MPVRLTLAPPRPISALLDERLANVGGGRMERAVSLTSIREILSPPTPPAPPAPIKSARSFFAHMTDRERGPGGGKEAKGWFTPERENAFWCSVS